MSHERDQEDLEGGIKVTDKRRFDDEGKPRPDAERVDASVPTAAESAPEPTDTNMPPKAPQSTPQEETQHTTPIDFSTFILSLATSAQVHLGVIPNPASGKEEVNLGLARETIDMLSMLQEKTKGNLTDEERRLFEHILYDVRMLFVEKSRSPQ